jgi:hypothetical protein
MALSAAALAFLVLCPGNALAEEESGFLFEVADGAATVTGYVGEGGDVVIPKMLGGCPTLAIGDGAFYENHAIVSVTIPDGVMSVGEYAFSNCSRLASVSIGWGASRIGDFSFDHCISLRTLDIDSGEIGTYAFWRCGSLTTAMLGEGVTSIGNYAFWECASLSEVVIPSSVMSIGTAAFYACSSLHSIVIPDNVVDMGSYVFWECQSLTSAKLGSGLTRVEAGTFSYCTSLSSLTITDRVTSIEPFAFCHCSSLVSISIPDSIASIGQYAFFMCPALALVEVGANVTSIGDNAFAHCGALESLALGGNLQRIGNEGFAYCSSLPYVMLPASVSYLGDAAFLSCTALSSVVFEGEVSTIGSRAFANCRSLISITFHGERPPAVGMRWIQDAPLGIEGHATAGSGFPAPGGRFSGLLMGELLPTVPSAPTGLSFTPGDANATITWSAPRDSGGGPVLGYRVYQAADPAWGFTLTASPYALSCTFAGLVNGKTYWIKVSAVNTLGEGAASGAIQVIPGTPSAPMNVTARACQGGVRLSWSEPGSFGPGTVTSYNIFRRTAEALSLIASVDGKALAWEDASPPAGIVCAYAIAAVNVNGQGPISNDVLGMSEVAGNGADWTPVLVAGAALVALVVIVLMARRR